MAAGEAIGTITQDPDAILSWTIDWSDWLNGLSIGGSSYSLHTTATGVTISGATFSATTTTFVFSGGTPGLTYKIRNRVTTSTATGAPLQRDDRTLNAEIIEK